MYQKNTHIIKNLDFILLDLLAVVLAISLAFTLRDGLFSTLHLTRFRVLVEMMVLFDIVAILLLNTMSGVLKRGMLEEIRKTLLNTIVLISLFFFFIYEVKADFSYSNTFSGLGILFYFIFSIVIRISWKHVKVHYMKDVAPRSIMLITIKSQAEELVNKFLEHNEEHYYISGVVFLDVDDDGSEEKFLNIPLIKGKKAAISYASRNWVDEILFLTNDMKEEDAELLEKFRMMGITVHMRLFYSKELMPNQYVEQFNGMTVLTSSSRYVTFQQLFFKRLLDIIGGLIGSAIAVLILMIVGPIIKIQSPGPILFKQIRVGRGGKRFVMYKIRSMHPDAEARKAELMKNNKDRDPRMFKMEFDPRIIGCEMLPNGKVRKGIGNFIRDYSLDEFPQFFNVLQGEMSLVGTRPPTEDEWEQYDIHHRSRLAIKPGITGLWQTSGRSNIIDFEDVVKLDYKYIQEWNFAMDIRLLFKTVFSVLRKEGAM